MGIKWTNVAYFCILMVFEHVYSEIHLCTLDIFSEFLNSILKSNTNSLIYSINNNII